MQKSRLGVKYNILRAPVDFIYGRHQVNTFFNKPLKKGKFLATYRLINLGIKRCKLSSPLKMDVLLPWVLTSTSCVVRLGRARRGKQSQILPVPVRRNKKISIFLQEFFDLSGTHQLFSLAAELLGGFFDTRGTTIVDNRRKKIYLAYQQRTEQYLRRW